MKWRVSRGRKALQVRLITSQTNSINLQSYSFKFIDKITARLKCSSVPFSCHGTHLRRLNRLRLIGRNMTDKTMAILALNFLFGVLLLCRVGFQIYKRNDMYQRYQRIPSSATFSTLTFDTILACFLIGVALIIST